MTTLTLSLFCVLSAFPLPLYYFFSPPVVPVHSSSLLSSLFLNFSLGHLIIAFTGLPFQHFPQSITGRFQKIQTPETRGWNVIFHLACNLSAQAPKTRTKKREASCNSIQALYTDTVSSTCQTTNKPQPLGHKSHTISQATVWTSHRASWGA